MFLYLIENPSREPSMALAGIIQCDTEGAPVDWPCCLAWPAACCLRSLLLKQRLGISTIYVGLCRGWSDFIVSWHLLPGQDSANALGFRKLRAASRTIWQSPAARREAQGQCNTIRNECCFLPSIVQLKGLLLQCQRLHEVKGWGITRAYRCLQSLH